MIYMYRYCIRNAWTSCVMMVGNGVKILSKSRNSNVHMLNIIFISIKAFNIHIKGILYIILYIYIYI